MRTDWTLRLGILLPRSLFGRLVLVLIGGLLVAQLLERGHQSGGARPAHLQRPAACSTAQRIADIVDLLDAAGRRPSGARIVAVLNAPPLVLSLHPTLPLQSRGAARGGWR
ncbi:MAG: hypothetical protein MZW92_80070 [Comamonadaceae bacterium]|nr:hypothetical protein [Comamonadaceae bacterium]